MTAEEWARVCYDRLWGVDAMRPGLALEIYAQVIRTAMIESYQEGWRDGSQSNEIPPAGPGALSVE